MRMIRRKTRQDTGIVPEAGFPAMGSEHYLPYLQAAHAELKPQVYFEIGTESGASLSFAECISIAVDPRFRLEADVSRNKPELHLYQGTSDDFFASGLLDRLGLKIDLAFLDGMHRFEFLLRDFIHTERHMQPDGVITLHDCVPFNHLVAERDWDRKKTGSWTGDVWKLIPILRAYRPDLTVEVLDLAPTGLVRVTGFGAANTALADNYDEIVSHYLPLSLADYGLARFTEGLGLKPARPAAPPRPQPVIERVAIRTSIPDAATAETWGDIWFARGLKAAFERRGLPCTIDFMTDWPDDHQGNNLNIFLLGHDAFTPPGGQPTFVWYIYPGKRYSEADLANYDHVFVASKYYAKVLRDLTGCDHISYLPQAFDADVMLADGAATRGDSLVFVAKAHFQRTSGIAGLALASGAGLDIWGDLWPAPFDGHVRGTHLANDKLAGVYAGALAVLCDHQAQMRRKGFISNRIFDALAVGAPVISDRIRGLPSEFAPYVHVADTAESFAAALAAIRAEPQAARRARSDFAAHMRKAHSFDARADEMLKTARAKGYSLPGVQV